MEYRQVQARFVLDLRCFAFERLVDIPYFSDVIPQLLLKNTPNVNHQIHSRDATAVTQSLICSTHGHGV